MTKNQHPLILIVDDNGRNIQVLGNLLSAQLYNIAVAMDGRKAINFMDRRKPDLILMDILMPGMNGYEVCRRIKEDPENEDIPVIFLSAKGDEESVVMAFEAGGVDYVSKPFRSMELLARVRTHIEFKQTKETLRAKAEEIQALRGILPICSACKKVRDDKGYWEQVDIYLNTYTELQFSHGLCPECIKEYYPEFKHKKNDKK